jgi:hypothetical protein
MVGTGDGAVTAVAADGAGATRTTGITGAA